MALKKRGRVVFGTQTRYYVDDAEVTEPEYRAAFPDKLGEMIESAHAPDGHRPGIWPMYSEALAVHPSQVAEANERAAKLGLGVKYQTGTGVCEIASDGDKVKLVRAEGFINKQAGFR